MLQIHDIVGFYGNFMFSFRNIVIPVGAVQTAYQSKVPSIKDLMSLSLTLHLIA